MKMAVFWVVAPCSLAQVYRRFIGACCLHHRPDVGGSKNVRNVGELPPDYTAQQPRRQPSSDHIVATMTLDTIVAFATFFCPADVIARDVA
jgi:hypothetical protein